MASDLLKRIQIEGNPLIDGEEVTFLWVGRQSPGLMADFSDWERGEMIKLTQVKEDLWVYQTRLPMDAYIEYAFFIEPEKRILDPYNSNLTPDGFGHTNHYFYMPGATETDLIRSRRSVPHGKVTRHQVETWRLVDGKLRTVRLYQPPTSEPSPLLVVWDGQDFFRRGKLVNILDNLIHQKRIRPVATAFVDHGLGARMPEYAYSKSTLIFLRELVLPLAARELNLSDINQYPGSYAVLGASMGGLMALYTTLRLPQVFGTALCFSGGFALGDRNSVVFELIERGHFRPIKVWLDVGIYDFQSLLAANRRLYALLKQAGYDVTYHEYPGGHNYPCWRNEVWKGLELAFGVVDV